MDTKRLALAARSLTGIAIGDAFGESFFGKTEEMRKAISSRKMPVTSWNFTDDTITAIALYRSLEKSGTIDPGYVCRLFLTNYERDPSRGYGPSMHLFFRELKEGRSRSEIAAAKFEGMGSMGNGGAMRAALIGAYFYDDPETLVREATVSCTITHTHEEAICGAIAVALAGAFATRLYLKQESYSRSEFLENITAYLPACDTSYKIKKALAMDGNHRMDTMVAILGNGERMLAQDTVPLALWCAARHLDHFESCLWEMVSALGDRDTLCAIAGGIAIMPAMEARIPEEWTQQVESWRESIFYQ